MSAARLTLAGVAGIFRRDARIYTSYRLRVALQLGGVLLSLALFFYLSRLVDSPRFPSPREYFAYVVVGLAIVEVLTAAMTSVPTNVRTELIAGTFERLVVSPLGPVAGIVGMALFPVSFALVTSSATVVLGCLVFGLDLHWPTVPLAVPVALLGACAFLPFALLVTAAVLLMKQVGSVTAYIVTGLSLTSGVLFPVDLLPGWLRWTSEVQPLTPALDLLRHLLVGTPLDDPVAAELARLVLSIAVLLPLSLAALALAIERGRRSATLVEW